MTTDANRLTPRAMSRATGAATTPTAAATQLRAFTDALERLGYDVAAMLARVGLRQSELADPDAVVPCAALDQVVRAACEARRTANLGAHLAMATPIGAYPLLDYLVVTSDDVGSALEQLVRYMHLTEPPFTLRLVEDDVVRLIVEPGTNPFITQYMSALTVRHLRTETERRLRVSFVSLMVEPDDERDLERLLECPVRAPSMWSGVEFPRDAMPVPLRRRDSVLHRVLEGHAAERVPRGGSPEDRTAVASVRAILQSRLSRGVPSIDVVARQLATAPRTLQRRLSAEGVTYQQIVDWTRREGAERLLADASLAVGEIGYLLGFSEPSAFHRAFKRWHQMTPQEYRQAFQSARRA